MAEMGRQETYWTRCPVCRHTQRVRRDETELRCRACNNPRIELLYEMLTASVEANETDGHEEHIEQQRAEVLENLEREPS